MTDKKETLKQYRALKTWHAKKLKLAEAAGQADSPMAEYLRTMVRHIEIRISQVKHA